MSQSTLAMRCVCRSWCAALASGIQRLLLRDPGPRVLWACHLPALTHMALGRNTDVAVQPLAPAAGNGVADGADDRGGGGPGSSATAVRSLDSLTSLRSFHVSDGEAQLQLAATCASLEELVVYAQQPVYARQRDAYRDLPSPVCPPSPRTFRYDTDSEPAQGPTSHYPAMAFCSESVVERAVKGATDKLARQAACDHSSSASGPSQSCPLADTLQSLPMLQRLQLVGLDVTGLPIATAMASLRGLTSLRLLQCRVPPRFSGPGDGDDAEQSEHLGQRLTEALGPRLHELSLRGCRLRSLSPDLLCGLLGLRVLDLSDNALEALPDEITLMAHLQRLDASLNRLVCLPDGLGALSRLTSLSLACNEDLPSLPPSFGELTGLVHLEMGALPGLDVAACIPLLTRLTNLNTLGICSLRLPLPNGVVDPILVYEPQPRPTSGPLGQMASMLATHGRLRELLLEGCSEVKFLGSPLLLTTQLTRLSAGDQELCWGTYQAIPYLVNLQHLTLRSSGVVSEIPQGVYQLTGLRVLDLEDFNALGLHPDISRLRSLQVLNAFLHATDDDYEDDEEVPPYIVPWTELYSLTRLRRLRISVVYARNPQPLPPGIGALQSLEDLRLQLPYATGALPELAAHVRGLASLSLIESGTQRLPDEVSQLTLLTRLDMRANKLTALPPGIGALTRLRTLLISGNKRLRALPESITRLHRMQHFSWQANTGGGAPPPSRSQLAWMAGVPRLQLSGSRDVQALARATGIELRLQEAYPDE